MKTWLLVWGVIGLCTTAGSGQSGPDVIAQLVAKLGNPDAERRAYAAMGLGGNGPQAKQAVPALARLAHDDPDPDVRFEAARALGFIGVASPVAVGSLKKAVLDKQAEVCCAAALALARLGALPEEASTHIGLAFTGKIPARLSTVLQRDVLAAAKALGAQGGPLVPGLRAALRHKEPKIQQSIIEILEDLGPGAKDAIPDIQPLLKDDDIRVRAAATFALLKMAPQDKDGLGKLVQPPGELPVPWSRLPLTRDQGQAIAQILAKRDEKAKPAFDKLEKITGIRKEQYDSAIRYLEAKDRASRGLDPEPWNTSFLRPTAKSFLATERFLAGLFGGSGNAAPAPRPPALEPANPEESALRKQIGGVYVQAREEILRLLTERQKSKL